MTWDKWGTYGDHVCGNIANAASPALWGLVQYVVDANASILLGKGIKVLLEENILRGNIGKDQIDFGLITGGPSPDDGPHDLQHRSNSSPAGNHAEVSHHVRSVDKGTLRSTDTNRLANHERGHVLGNIALGVGLDEKVKVTGLVVTRDGSVGADNLLGGAVGLDDGSANGDMLADGETQDGLGAG